MKPKTVSTAELDRKFQLLKNDQDRGYLLEVLKEVISKKKGVVKGKVK